MTPYSWRKSTHSGSSNGSCVEVADGFTGALPVRDSKDPAGPALTFTPDAWSAFLAALTSGEQLSTTSTQL
ncbi:hypothetical protein P3T35_000567 [Kitasatospora sp. GP30]|uniref:DUF397 domain-containing protein n=1 Tax=Kitasatospora sp. GP30 TaxID=3035084 RepID=UPI000C7093CA|nr:DUF397 domain-containing protein [Kitasatospora sp. GP30]MDH6138590.1 hypothetical protein [Kitasatospora sp. GP30]